MIDQLYLRFIDLNSEQLKIILNRPPLASALQNFETAVFLSAHGWHPQALSLLASAIESAGRAHFRIPIDERTDLSTLGPSITQEFPKGFEYITGRGYQLGQFRQFREKRNAVTHYGSSPADSEEAAYLIYSFAIPCLNDFIRLCVGISIISNLSETISTNLIAVIRLLQNSGQHKISTLNVVGGITHAVRHQTRGANLSWWERELINDSDSWEIFDFKKARKEKLQKDDPYIMLNCPVCLHWEESLVVRIDQYELEKGNISLDLARCFECDWESTSESKELLCQLCEDQITKELVGITLSSYGIKSD